MNFDLTKFDVTKINFRDVKTIKILMIGFLVLVFIIDLILFIPLINKIAQTKDYKNKDVVALKFLKELASKKDTLMTAQLISANKVDDLLDQIQKIAQQSGVKANIGVYLNADKDDTQSSDQSKQENGSNLYETKTFSITTLSSLKNTGNFLMAIRNMPDAIVDIGTLDLSGDKILRIKVQAQINFTVLTMKDDKN